MRWTQMHENTRMLNQHNIQLASMYTKNTKKLYKKMTKYDAIQIFVFDNLWMLWNKFVSKQKYSLHLLVCKTNVRMFIGPK